MFTKHYDVFGLNSAQSFGSTKANVPSVILSGTVLQGPSAQAK